MVTKCAWIAASQRRPLMESTRRLRITATAFLAALLLSVASGAPIAEANQYSPVKCDPTPKYHCSYIDYDISGGYYIVHARVWQGAIDGGARRWQLLYAIDYRWNGSSWEASQYWGETAWLTNLYLGSWYAYNGDNWMTGGAAVVMKFRHEECYSGGCYFWSDPADDHPLS